MVMQSCRKKTDLIYDAHLMIRNPDKYLPDFLKAGCEAITFHIEAVPEPVELLRKIKAADRVAGLAINPQTPTERIKPFLNECDLILVMSVEPGFGGQKFIHSALDKLKQLKELASSETILSVDGGVAADTITSCSQAGAGLFVCGSSVFDQPDYSKAISNLVELANVII
jgi:ribulose-phosphate 3-epimerase